MRFGVDPVADFELDPFQAFQLRIALAYVMRPPSDETDTEQARRLTSEMREALNGG